MQRTTTTTAALKAAVTEAKVGLLTKDPFYFHFSQELKFNETFPIQTACVGYRPGDLNGFLAVNADFFMPLGFKERMFVLEHEILHWVYRHPLMGIHDPDFNVACDCSINRTLINRGGTMPSGDAKGVLAEDIVAQYPQCLQIPELNPPSDPLAGSMDYYAWIKKLRQAIKQEKQKNGSSGTKAPSQGQQGDGSLGDGPNPSGQLPPSTEDDSDQTPGGEGNHPSALPGEKTPESLEDYLDQLAGVCDHNWQHLSPSEETDILHQLATSVTQAMNKLTSEQQRVWGNVKGTFEALLQAFKEHQIPWNKQVRQFLTYCGEPISRPTYGRLNKYGYAPKMIFLPGAHIAFCLDTSGSMSDATIQLCLAEMEAAKRAGLSVDFIQFDHGIQSHEPLRSRKNTYQIHGRGGTSFDLLFDYLDSIWAKKRYSGVVVATDGYAPFPDSIGNKKVLWIVADSDVKIPKHLGNTVYIKEKGEIA